MMQPRRSHPLFSRLGCTAALLLGVGLLLAVAVGGGTIFSPGRLSAQEGQSLLGGVPNHAALDQQCEQCHAPWRGIEAGRCEQCHEAVAAQRAGGEGLHGLLPDTGRCDSCHTEHGGAEAALTQVGADIFPHQRLTGFSLAHHAADYEGNPLTCEGCHTGAGLTAEGVDCQSCHTAAEPAFMAEHQATFGNDCTGCHDGQDSMADFEHATVFPLEGAHAVLACESCHNNQVFAGTPEECAGCHQEPAIHESLFGTACGRCHTADAWQPARLAHHTFPLDHGEAGLQECQVCHEESYTQVTCYGCHEHDPAEVRETHLDEGIREFEECASCHPTGREDEADDRLEEGEDE